jgi:signal transduction histidine kinase
LYICKGIVEAHGGRIWAKNNSVEKNIGNNISGNGATFGFSLPLAHI